MTNDQIGEVEAIVNSIVETDSPVFVKELSLTSAKVVPGLRTCTKEVSDVCFSAGGCLEKTISTNSCPWVCELFFLSCIT